MVQLGKQQLNTFLCTLQRLELRLQFLILVEIFFVPLLAVSVLPWELFQLLASLMHLLLQLRVGYSLLLHFCKQCFIVATEPGD